MVKSRETIASSTGSSMLRAILRAASVAVVASLVVLPPPTATTRVVERQTCRAFPLLVYNVNIWTSSGIAEQRSVLLRDGKIASIQNAGARPPQGFHVIDGTGHTLLPGLIDAHLHFVFPGGLPAASGPRTDASELAARELIRSGVTSGRLHLAPLDEATQLKALAQDECAAIPRLQVGGPGISGALEKDFSSFQGARTEAEAVAKVERFRASGVDWIAIHDAHRFPANVIKALTQAARMSRIRLMASAASPEETLAALSIEPDTLDYIDRTAQAEYPADVIDQIRKQPNLILVPTLGVARRISEFTKNAARLEDAENFGLLAPTDRAFLSAAAHRDLGGKEAAAVRVYAPTLPRKLRQLQKLGVPMAVGSDAGSMLQWPSSAIWWEMEAWRQAGASHREVLTAATEGGSRVLRQSDIGRIALGMRADFVLYRGNAEEGPFHRNRVAAVAKGGVLFFGEAKEAK